MPAIIDPQLFTNNAVSLLALPISQIALSFTVMEGHGAKFPLPTGDGSDWFLVTFESQDASQREIVKVIGRVGDVFTIDPAGRGLEGTIPQAWAASSGNDTLVDLRLTAETIRRLSNSYAQASYPAVTNYAEALDQLFNLFSLTGARLFDQPYTLTEAPGSTVITLNQPYVTGSLAIFIGGLRQKLNVDFTEATPDTFVLNFELTAGMVAEGQNLVIDFIPA
jgi:hypothetical protein